jgi:hypothetical protein
MELVGALRACCLLYIAPAGVSNKARTFCRFILERFWVQSGRYRYLWYSLVSFSVRFWQQVL